MNNEKCNGCDPAEGFCKACRDTELLGAAMDRRFPLPDGPDSPARIRLHGQRCAFENGWRDARASLPSAGAPVSEAEQTDINAALDRADTEDDARYPPLPDDLDTMLTVFDMGLGFALCHSDFASTRNAIKKLQSDFTAIRAALAIHQPQGADVMRSALERIARWHGEFPATGKAWPSGNPTSYGAEYGSNGERDYMRQVALDALAAAKQAGKEGA